ncbi:hypothetical protein EKK58_04865 [Candidatus Dependentiae bacterium]|nr:MAG: hypothetical protein EKK58_04865 [Candidatus Dependentiae bacterium]
MKIKFKYFLLGIFFIANSVKSMNHAIRFFHFIKQVPDLQFKHTKNLGCLFGLAGIFKFCNVARGKYVAGAYAKLHTECTHNTSNTADDFNVFRKAVKEYPNTYTNKQFTMFYECMKHREHNLDQFNECKKAVNTLTVHTKKADALLNVQQYIK